MKAPRIVVGHRVFDDTLAMLREIAEVVAPSDGKSRLTPLELQAALETADAWMAFMPDSVDAALLARAPHLKLIAGALKGGDNFDVPACTKAGVWFSLVPDLLTIPTAELTIALMIGLGRNVLAGDCWVRSGSFHGWEPRFYGTGLAGARIGLIGMGAIGRAIAERLRGFGVEQRYHDQHRIDAAREADLDLAYADDLEQMLSWSDYVVLAVPLTPKTFHLIDADRLGRMRRGALLINPSRGSLVDEAAVLKALEAGHLGGYAADVFEMEDWALPDRPRDISPALRDHSNTLFTPHLGSAVVDVRKGIERRAAENIMDLLGARIPRDAVNPEAREAVVAR